MLWAAPSKHEKIVGVSLFYPKKRPISVVESFRYFAPKSTKENRNDNDLVT